MGAVGAVFEQEVFLDEETGRFEAPPQRDLVDIASLVQIGDGQVALVVADLDQLLVVFAEPAEFFPAPGAEGVGTVVAAPAESTQAHQPPLADAG